MINRPNFVKQMAIDRVCPQSGEPATPYEHGQVAHWAGFGVAAIRAFVERVNERAESNMEKTGKLEGSHYAAMQSVLKELGAI